ncbi:predicted protein [Naegleria gruberi]|uniref:Predicted protein n=1 Tax=Naegleria gruberi TaxID=5762 RepID=D2VB01_NAEGR|nr:uncharacterized protein NAEGRDRAFT_66039 [Naegleria gruberi]EFC46173.1 predicted protein [Naegleria gruberi]|eukprot:XP_002678917.1 predicted protein [Naegleria gruberi strain NEG-M]
MAGPSWKCLLSEFKSKYIYSSDGGTESGSIYKKLIRDELSNLIEIKQSITNQRPISISVQNNVDTNISSLFDERILKQFIGFVMGRIRVKEIYYCNLSYSDELVQLFDSYAFSELDFDSFEIKLVFEIIGVGEYVMRRNFSFDMDFLGYSRYVKNFFIYISTLQDDLKNFQSNEIFNVNEEERELPLHDAFIFRKRKDQYETSGEESLLKALNQIVPELKQYDLSPLNYIPIWLMILGKVLSNFGCNRPFREVFKCSNNYSNPLMRNILSHRLEKKVNKLLSVLQKPIYQKVIQLIEEYDVEENNTEALSNAITEMEYNLPKRVRKMDLYTFHNSSMGNRIQNVKNFFQLMNYERLMDYFIKYACDP